MATQTTTIDGISATATGFNGSENIMISQGGVTKKASVSLLMTATGVPKSEGGATTTTDPGTPSGVVFYNATQPGTYTNFKDSSGNPIVVNNNEIATLRYNGTAWEKISQTVDSASHIHIKYSDDNGVTFTANNGDTPGNYMGTLVDFNATASTNIADYKFAKITGPAGSTGSTGATGTAGTNGQTSYLHIKYSDDGGATFTLNNGDDPGKYIGTYTDFIAADSTNVATYKWALLQGQDNTATFTADTLNDL